MIQTLRHRGPDGIGYHRDGEIGLAHARLAIIDLVTGEQPMCNEIGTVWATFNGEIFNYVELRSELQRLGHVFKTTSDTETIVHAYEQYSDDFVTHLNGQFAIAIWDAPRHRLVLARDRVGIRPLFFQQDGGRLLFGSEIKSILAVSSRRPELDLRGLAQVFTFWSTVGDRTTFEGIRSLPPAHLLVVEDGRLRCTRYWDWTFPLPGEAATISFDEAAEELRALLSDAVRLQLRADVPVGAYLSGGLDSSALVGLIRENSQVPLHTFSIAFGDAEFDESPFQQAIVRHFGTSHTSKRCSNDDIADVFVRLVEHTETPILRTAPAPLMILSDLVRRSGFKVVLTGEGADEIFAGYDIFKEAQIRRFWARQPRSAWRPRLLSRLYRFPKHSPTGSALSQSFFAQGLEDTDSPFYAHKPRWATTSRLWAFFSDERKAELAGYESEGSLRDALPPNFKRWSALGRDQYVEAQTMLSGYLLSSQGDRVAMANSVEGRVPFLDHRVIEFANRLPPRYKLRGLVEKAVLRKAVKGLLPPAILNRVKQPYRAPDSQAFFVDGKPRELIEEMLSDTRIREAGYFNPMAIRRLIDKCRAGKVIGFSDNMAFIGVLSTMIVHDRFVRRANSLASTPV
jgi:asparagine synthase (glutamine-hydrolysing)